MKQRGRIALAAALSLGVATATTAWADDHGAREKGEQVASEKRSEQAGKNSNAQWQHDATRGQERAVERKHQDSDAGEGAKQHRRHEKLQRAGERHEHPRHEMMGAPKWGHIRGKK